MVIRIRGDFLKIYHFICASKECLIRNVYEQQKIIHRILEAWEAESRSFCVFGDPSSWMTSSYRISGASKHILATSLTRSHISPPAKYSLLLILVQSHQVSAWAGEEAWPNQHKSWLTFQIGELLWPKRFHLPFLWHFRPCFLETICCQWTRDNTNQGELQVKKCCSDWINTHSFQLRS